jgi:hypothetical protein
VRAVPLGRGGSGVKRVLALAGAVAMVVVAVLVRTAGDDDGGAAAGGSGSGSGSGDGAGAVVVCATELAEACRALPGATVLVEDAGTTADALRAGTLRDDVDGWLVPAAWVDVVASGDRPDALVGRGRLVASTPVVLAVDEARAGAVADLCPGAGLLRCVGSSAGAPWADLGGEARWGALRIGLPPADTGTGLVVLAAIATSFFDGTDFARQDFDLPGGGSDGRSFRVWLTDLARTGRTGDASPVRTLVTARGTYTAAGALRAEAELLPVQVLDVEPEVLAEATLVQVAGGGRLPDVAPARDVLVDAGWDAADSDAPSSRHPPGVLAALRALWSEVAP